MNDPYTLVGTRTRCLAGLRIEITESTGGAYAGWSRFTTRFVVGVAHPDHFGKDSTRPTYTLVVSEGPTERQAVRNALAAARAVWCQGASL